MKYRYEDIKSVENLRHYSVDEVDWNDVSTHMTFYESDLREYADYLDWSWIMVNLRTALNVNLIREFADKITNFKTRSGDSVWNTLASYRILSDKLIEEFMDKFIPWIISEKQTYLSEQFMDRWSNILSWNYLCKKQTMSEEFIEKHMNKLYMYWEHISQYQKLSEKFIEKYKDRVVWFNITKYQTLSEPFIVRFGTRCGINNICTYQKLSESFIREFRKLLDWDAISHHQKLSKEFVREFRHDIRRYNFRMSQAHLMNDKLFVEEYESWGRK